MRRIVSVMVLLGGCGQMDTPPCPDAAAAPDLSMIVEEDLATAAPTDGGVMQCFVDGNPGQCMDATACGALPAWSAVAGYCPGAANVQCCVLTPNVANNPPVPSGWMLMQQAQVTPEMTAWAVQILNTPMQYPIFSTALRTFGSLTVMARVEWHPPDFQNSAVHRGVTLYVP